MLLNLPAQREQEVKMAQRENNAKSRINGRKSDNNHDLGRNF